MQITQNIALDLNRVGVYSCALVEAKQGDNASRFVCVALTVDGVKYTPSGVTAKFRCVKPDGCSCYDPAAINADGTITVELTEQVLAAPGWVDADICLCGDDGDILSTASFKIHVEPAPLGKNVTSTNEFLALMGIKAGGYYTPSVSQPTDDTMRVDFTPSSEDMPVVEGITVTLPAGAGSGAASATYNPETGELII